MNIKQVRERLKKIEEVKSDCESAHSYEDGMWRAVLQAIANGEAEDPAALARECLKSEDIDFERWFA